MSILRIIINFLDSFTEAVGKTSSYLSILMVLVTCYVVVARYVFNSGSIAIQESIIYINALFIFLAVGYTLKHNAHVRVDIVYNIASERYKAWVNLLGSIFLLLPVTLFILISSWTYIMSSWAILEDSPDAGGLPFVYLLKSTILVMCFLLIIQAIAEILRNISILFFPEIKGIDLEDEENTAI